MKKQPTSIEAPVRPAPTRHKRGWVDNSPTPAQLKAFLEQIPTEDNPNGLNTSERLQKYLRNTPFVGTPAPASATKEPDNDLAQRIEQRILATFPNRVHEIMEVFEPVLVPGFKLDILPLMFTSGGTNSSTPEGAMQQHARHVFWFWFQIDHLTAHILREGSPFITMGSMGEGGALGAKTQGYGGFYRFIRKTLFAEPLKLHYTLHHSLEKKVSDLCCETSRIITGAFYDLDVVRYGLANSGCASRVANVTDNLMRAAVTMAAVGDFDRMKEAKAAFHFQLQGNPLVDYDPETKACIVLTSPRLKK